MRLKELPGGRRSFSGLPHASQESARAQRWEIMAHLGLLLNLDRSVSWRQLKSFADCSFARRPLVKPSSVARERAE